MATTTTLDLAASLAVSAYAPVYTDAAAGAGATVSEWFWIGQYPATDQFEINQAMAAFDTTVVTGGLMSASLTITVDESHGNTILEVREHDWAADASAFVPGSALASKRLLGSAPIGPGGQRDITIALASFDLSRPLKFVLAIADQRLGAAPAGDTTLLVSNARLAVTTAIITKTGAGTWTVPAGVTSITVECWGGGGAGRYGAGGAGGAWTQETLAVSPGQAFDFFIAASQPYSADGAETIGQDTWFGSAATVLAKGAAGHVGGQASAGRASLKYSGGSARYQDPNTGLPGSIGESTYGGSGASASKHGDGGDSFYNPMTGTGTGGSSPGAGAVSLSHVEGGGGSAGIGSGGAPGGGSRAAPSTRGQIRITWTFSDDEPGPGDTTPPTITSPSTASVAENTVNPTGALTADETVTWSIAGGADAALFSITGSTWTLNATPDFETKNTYAVVFRATDGAGNYTDQTFTLTITDVAEGGGGASWTPADLGQKLLWLDMDDPTTIAFSNYPNISTLFDKSGNGRNAVSANPPSHVPAAIGGRPAAYFLNDRMTFTRIPAGTTISAFYAFKGEGPQALSTLMGDDTSALMPIGASSSASNTEVWRGSSAPAIRRNGSPVTWSVRGQAHAALTDSEAQVLALNGMTLTANVIWLGAGPFSYFFRGHLGEVVIVTGALSVEETARLEGYLAHKWGTAGALPASHPFKAAPPTTGTPAPTRRAPRSFFWL